MPVGALAGLYTGAAQSLMTQRVGAHEQGELQGAGSSVMGLVGLIGPGLFSVTFALGIATVTAGAPALPGAPFYVAALLTAGAFAIGLKVARPLPAAAGAP